MPNLYVDRGLAMTRFILQKQSGGSWVNSSKYDYNQRHRFRAQFHNTYFTDIPQGGGAFGNCDIHVVDLRLSVKLPGAVFDGWGQDSAILTLMPGSIDNHPDFTQTIKPSRFEWFEFGYFTWRLPDAPVSSVAFTEFYSFHREVMHIPFAPMARMIATAA